MIKIVKSLKFKILITIVVILSTGIFAETIIWTQNTIKQTKETMVNSFTSSLSVANQNFETSMKDIERIVALASSNMGEGVVIKNYFRVMQPDSLASDLEKLQAGREVKSFLLELCRFQFYLTGASINDLNGHQETYGIIMGDAELREQEWLNDFLESTDEVRIIAPHDSFPNDTTRSKRVFSIVRKIMSGSEVRGIMLTDINYDILQDFYYMEDSFAYPVFIKDGMEGETQIFPEENENDAEKERKIEITLDIPITGWSVHGIIQQKEIVSSSMHILGRIFLISIALNILICIVVVLAVSHITKELSVLADSVKHVSGEQLELATVIKSEDEVGELYKQINRMLKQIRELIKEIQDSEHAKRELEILALQEQINPHFLYNTLNTITYLSQLRGAKNIEFVSSSLSDMLHLALNQEKYITIEREIDYLRQYLMIMEYKYAGKFIPEFQVDENVYTCKIPKLIMQPLVENALKHGIAALSRPGYLRISVDVEDNRLKLSVWDNGNGISEELLAKINQIPMENEMRTALSIGVYNVRNRIYLLYGSRGNFKMSSTVGEYTLAEIEIPITTEEDGV